MLPPSFANWFHSLFTRRVPVPGASRRKALGSQFGLLVLGCALWCINWFPIQTSGHVLSGTAVLSGQRWTALTGLCQSMHIESDTIRWLDYRRTRSGGMGQHTDLTQIRLHVGLSRPASVADIERELDRLTRSTGPAPASNPVAKQIRARQWQLEVTQHQMQRFKLDREREGVSLAAFERPSPFRQASYSTTPHENGDVPRQLSEADLDTWNRLVTAEASHRIAIEAMQRSLEEQRSQSDGHIAITGAPKLLAMAGRFSWSRVASVLCLAMVAGLALLAMNNRLNAMRHPSRRNGVPAWRSLVAKIRRPSPILTTDEKQLGHNSARVRTTVKKLRQLQIPYWGEALCQEPLAEILQQTELSSQASPETSTDLGNDHYALASSEGSPASVQLSVEPQPSPPTASQPTRRRTSFVAVFGDAILLTWVIVFLARFTCDSLWRDLVFRAPLAAFSSLLFGV